MEVEVLHRISNQVTSWVSTAGIASVCAAGALMVLESSLSTFAVGILSLCLIIIGLIRTEWLLFVALLSGIFYTPLERFSSRVFGILVIPMDAIFLLSMVIILIKTISGGRSANSKDTIDPLDQSFKLTKIVTGVFLLIFFIAMLIGLFRNHYWQTVFSEGKLALYYGAIPLIAGLFGARKIRLEVLMFFLVAASALGSLYDLYARVFDIYTVSAYSGGVEGAVAYADTPLGDIIRDYGWASTFAYQVFSVLISFVFILQGRRILTRLGWLALLLINLVANLLTVTRGFMFSLLIGVFAVLVFSSLSVAQSWRVRWRKLIGRFTIGVLLLVGVFFAVGQVIPQANAAFYRLFGVIDRSYAGAEDVYNMEYRLQSIQTGLSNALEQPLGRGFGTRSPASSRSTSEWRVVYLIYHNSLGYMLYTFGFPGTIAVIVIFTVLIFRLIGLIRKVEATEKRTSVALLSCLLALLAMSFTTGNSLFIHNNSLLPFVVIIVAATLYCIQSNAWEINH